MPFDFEKLMSDPMFAGGMAMFAGGQPGGGGMGTALAAMQAMQRTRQQDREFQADQTYRQQRLELDQANSRRADEQAKLYGQQIKVSEEGLKLKQDAQKTFNSILPTLMQQLGMVEPSGMAPAADGSPAPMVSKGFENADKFVAGKEGTALVGNDAGKGPSKYGVLQSTLDRFMPGKKVDDLTPEEGKAVRQQFWKIIGADKLDPAAAMVAYDSAINQGDTYARNLIETTGGNPALMLQKRREDYRNLAKQPIYAQYLPVWEKRLDDLKGQVATAPAKPQGLDPSQATGVMAGVMKAQQGDPAAGLSEISKAMEPKFAAPGSVNTRTGEMLPNPSLDETKRKNAVEEAQANTRIGIEQGNLEERRLTGKRESAQAEQKLGEEKTKIYQAIQSNDQMMDVTIRDAKKLLNSPGLNQITGRVGGMIPPMTKDAIDALALLETLQSKAFVKGTLGIRQASPTGAGVGNQSDFEGKRLENSVARLGRVQSFDSIKNALNDFIETAESSKKNIRSAYEAGYGKPPDVPTQKLGENNKQIVRQYKGAKTGKTVIEYSDGTTEYAR